MNVVVDGLMLNYQLSGKGRLILLLHGWGDRADGLQAIAQGLSLDYQVLALDLPGFGNTQAPKDVWNLDNYAEFLDGCLKKLDLKQPYAVIGHSNGGALAIRAVSLGKLQPDRLVLLAASGVRTNNQLKRILLNILAKTGNVATLWMPGRYRRALRKSLYGMAGSDMLLKPELEATFKKTVRQDVQKDAEKLKVKTLLVYGKADKDVPLADGQKYQQLIEGSKLEVIDGGSHFFHLEEPQRVIKIIREFLK